MLQEQDAARPTHDEPAGIDPRTAAAGADRFLYDANVIAPPGAEFFTPGHWRRAQDDTGTAHGRGTVCIFDCAGRRFVLRHYRRGGQVARLTRDLYGWTGLERTRAWREWRLLAALHAEGFPVPRPVAARVRRYGPFYRADLVTQYIDGTLPLADALGAESPDTGSWRGIGAAIARLHAAGVIHADLNARNILLGAGGAVWFVDFDKSERRTLADGDRRANLERLLRSLDKIAAADPARCAAPSARDALLSGYREAAGDVPAI